MPDIVLEQITLEKAELIIKNAISKAREIKINPIMVVLLDHRGAIKSCSGEDGISSLRFQIAHGSLMINHILNDSVPLIKTIILILRKKFIYHYGAKNNILIIKNPGFGRGSRCESFLLA